MRCGACGNEGKGKFCRKCGAPLQQEQEQELIVQANSSVQDDDIATPIHAAVHEESPTEANQPELEETPVEDDRIVHKELPAEADQTGQGMLREGEHDKQDDPSVVVVPVDTEKAEPSVEAEQTEHDEPSVEAEQTEHDEPSVEAEQTEHDEPSVKAEQTEHDEPSVEAYQPEQEEMHAEADESEQVNQVGNQRTSPLKAMIISSVIAGIIAALAVIGLAYGLDWSSKQGEFQEDVQYHLLSHVIQIPPEQAAYFIHSLKPGAWLQLMLMHGAEIKGEYGVSTGNGTNVPLMFSFQMTLLLSAACAFAFIAIASRLIYSIVAKRLTQLWKLLWIILFSLCYALSMGITLWLLSPKIELLYGNNIYTFELNAELWEVFVLTLLFSFVASIIGVGRWSFPQRLDLSSWLKSMAIFARTMLLFFIVIIALMTLSWSTTKPSQLHSTHMTTMGAVWDVYKDDPTMYGIIPNVLMQQFIYSLGATWHVDGQAAANLLSMERPMQLNLVTGATADDADRASLKPIEQDLRLHWFHAAFLLVFLYALSRIQMNKLWSYGCTVLIIIIGVAALSAYANVSVSAGNMDRAFLGFRFTQSLLSVGIITAIFLIASYSIQRLLARRGDLF